MLQDHCQVRYLKCFKDFSKIDIFPVALYHPKQGHSVKGYLSVLISVKEELYAQRSMELYRDRAKFPYSNG